MSDPVRLYSPNPDAPQYVGMGVPAEPPQPWYRGMGAALQNAPNALWMMLPPEARQAYSSGFNALVDMTTPAAVRDYTTAAQDTARSAVQGDGWGTATNALATVNAALGAIPVAGMGIRAGQKVARDVGKVAGEGATNFIRAYHGSPHDFDKFSLSKIGTGEGAQAYGHGLYFAENPAVAASYRESLAGQADMKRLDLGGMVLGPHNNFDYSRNAGRSNLDNIHASLAENVLIDQAGLYGAPDKQAFVLSKLDDMMKDYKTSWPEGYADAQRLRDRLARPGAVSLKMGQQPGKTYEVAINSSPAQFLDWDKPLTGQSDAVQAALAKFGYTPKKAELNAYDNALLAALDGSGPTTLPKQPNDPTGEAIYRRIAGNGPATDLLDAGIPGLKYLDATSRGTGEGSRNYVVFDDRLIEILRKYGLLPVAGAAGYAAMPGQEDNAR